MRSARLHAPAAVVKVPDINKQLRHFQFDLLHYGLKGQGKARGAKGVALLNSTPAQDGVFSKMEERLRAVAAFYPGRQLRDAGPDFFKHMNPTDSIESVGEVDL